MHNFTEVMTPASAAANGTFDFSKDAWVAEEKIDGARYLLYIGGDPYGSDRDVALLSRRKNAAQKYTDRYAQVPHIAKNYPGLEGTVLDGELFLNDCATTVSIVTSGPELAVAKQQELGKLTYYVYDVLSYCGKDVRLQPLKNRRKILEATVESINNPHIQVVPQLQGDDIEPIFHQIVSAGGEGLVVKNLNHAYGSGWIKLKKSYDVSVVIGGFQAGQGQYQDQVGALLLSVYDGDRLVEIGKTSGFDEALRSHITANPDQYLNTVIDVFAQELTPPSVEHPCGRLRHPSFHRLRPDMLPEHATFSTLKENIDATKRDKAQSFRRRTR